MAITKDDFGKVWASTSPLTPYAFSDAQYKEGWNFIGSTPPSRQMWDFLQKNNDEKMQYLANNYLPLSGGTMTGNARIGFEYRWAGITSKYTDNGGCITIYGGDGDNNGASLRVFGKNEVNSPGWFNLIAHNGTTSKQLIGKPDGTLTWDGQPLLPVGIVQAFAGTTIPSGWLLCDGSAVSRTDYADLFAVIGETYGAGDGSTTFNLPNLVDKFVEGSATAGTVKSAGLPNITGSFSKGGESGSIGIFDNASGSFSGNGSRRYAVNNSSGQYDGMISAIRFDASRSSSVYGNSTTVQPPALTMRYIIKY